MLDLGEFFFEDLFLVQLVTNLHGLKMPTENFIVHTIIRAHMLSKEEKQFRIKFLCVLYDVVKI
jgi:hypothetical protein